MTKRAHIPLKTKLAAALCQMLREEGGKLVPVIPYDRAKTMSADQIVAEFDFDHYPIMKANGGPDEPWNLVPRPREDHRRKTSGGATKARAKGDVTEISRAKRLQNDQAEFRRRILEKAPGEKPKRESKWPKRGFGKKVVR